MARGGVDRRGGGGRDLVVDDAALVPARRGRVHGRRRGAGGGAPGYPVRRHVHHRSRGRRGASAAALARGLRFIDAPVSGGVPRAMDGTLAIMVGGAAEDVRRRCPCFPDGGQRVSCGAGGARRGRQALQQLDRGRGRGRVSEAFRIAEGFGVDPKVVTDVICKSSGHTFLMEHMHPVPGMVERRRRARATGRVHDRSDVQGPGPRRGCGPQRCGFPCLRRPPPSRCIGSRPRTASAARISRASTRCSSRRPNTLLSELGGGLRPP